MRECLASYVCSSRTEELIERTLAKKIQVPCIEVILIDKPVTTVEQIPLLGKSRGSFVVILN